MAVREETRRRSQVPRPKGWVQQRYILAVMGSLCIMMMFILKVNFSVGIVAMVKPVSNSKPKNTSMLIDGKEVLENEDGEFSWDIETQGHILAAYFYGYVATQILGGYASSRWGGKVVVGPGIALTGFFTLFTAVAARQGGIHSGTVIGMAASGPLSKWPLEGGGWPMVFYFFGTIGLALIIPWWILVYDSPECHPRISEEEKNYILSGQGIEKNAMEQQLTAPLPWMSILTDIPVWTAIIYQWAAGWVVYTMLTDIPTYMKNVLHFDIEKVLKTYQIVIVKEMA
ncbi:sialin-like [Hetaerina americana]|uniref:sialin-like n=1 Tax=Hetaerina americana TaxID=62018 RepID=UPI003A7F1702